MANGARSALDLGALVDAVARDARVLQRTGELGPARARVGLRADARAHLDALATDERVAEMAVFAAAVVAADRVNTYCIVATSISIALVNICNLAGGQENRKWVVGEWND